MVWLAPGYSHVFSCYHLCPQPGFHTEDALATVLDTNSLVFVWSVLGTILRCCHCISAEMYIILSLVEIQDESSLRSLPIHQQTRQDYKYCPSFLSTCKNSILSCLDGPLSHYPIPPIILGIADQFLAGVAETLQKKQTGNCR